MPVVVKKRALNEAASADAKKPKLPESKPPTNKITAPKIPVLKKPIAVLKKKADPKNGVKQEEKKEVKKEEAEEIKKQEIKTVKDENEDVEIKEEVKEGEAMPMEEKKSFEEPDAPQDSRPPLKSNIVFTTEDTTLNVLQAWGGKVLTPITDAGMSYLLAGARANVGQKSGRYMFEVKIVQQIHTSHAGQKPKPLVKVGFSTSSSSLFLGETDDSICFESDGYMASESKRRPGGVRFHKDNVIALVLNLDADSPNKNTITLYKDGSKEHGPLPLPEALVGQTLFPHVTFRNASVRVNFGSAPLQELPFKCRLLQSAAATDVVAAPSKAPKDGKYEILMPVAFPDEGTFDWLDSFLEKNPHYVELSDRKIVEWAKSSGIWPKAAPRSSNDRPLVNFGIPAVDDFSTRKVIAAVASVVPRNYLIMEVKSNLLASERKDLLQRFNSPCYRKVAHVVMGEPSDEFKANVQNKLLKDRQAKADEAWRKAKAEDSKKRDLQKRERELKKARKVAMKKREEIRAKILADRKKREEEKKSKEDKPEEENTEEAGDETKPEEEKKDTDQADPEKQADSSDEEPEEDEDHNTEPPAVELDEHEKEVKFAKHTLPDLNPMILEKYYGKFSTPEKDEGFDEIRYEWEDAEQAHEYLRNWVLKKKRSSRIEDIQPGSYFREKTSEFAHLFLEWQEKQKEYKQQVEDEGKEENDDEAPDHKQSGFDVFNIEDVLDCGNGEPLFSDFTFEDWALVQLRFEFFLLLVSFKKDADDDDRTGIPMEHLGFYYQKYFNKTLTPKIYGVPDNDALILMIADTVASRDGILVTQLQEDLEGTDIFIKLAEEHRRDRQRRMDAGDMTVELNFQAALKGQFGAQKRITPIPAANKKSGIAMIKIPRGSQR